MQYTTYYELPQYEANDKTAWLTIFNQAMLTIDGAIHAAKAEAEAAETEASAAASSASSAQSSVTALTNSLNTLIGTVNTITSLIGNGEPTTTDKTIIGAINEINAKLGTPTVKTLEAGNTTVTFDVPTSGNNIVDVYASDGANYSAIDVSVSGKVTFTYETALYDRAITVNIREV